MAVEGTCGRVTKFNAKLFQLICIVTSAAVAGLGAWLYRWGSSFFGLEIIQLTIAIRIIGLALLVIGVAVLATTLVQCAVTACESRVCSLTVSIIDGILWLFTHLSSVFFCGVCSSYSSGCFACVHLRKQSQH